MKKITGLFLLFIVALLMPACTSSDEGIEVTWDGNECTVSGLTELPMGNHSFALIDLSDQEVDISVLNLLEGKTIQDFLDKQGEPGRYLYIKEWFHFSFQWMGPPKIDENGREVWTYILDKEGDYVIMVVIDRPGTQNLWLCTQSLFKVVETPSE